MFRDVAEVVELPQHPAGGIDLEALRRELALRGLHALLSEGGPRFFGSALAQAAVDELCLTVSPLLAGGDVSRVANGVRPRVPARLALRSALLGDSLFLRYGVVDER